MSVLDRVRALIERLSPEPICDDCIAATIDQVSGIESRELAGHAGFERSKDQCALCGDTKIVIRRR